MQFLVDVATRIDDSGIRAFEQRVLGAFQSIHTAAAESQRLGTSQAGVSSAFRGVQSSAQREVNVGLASGALTPEIAAAMRSFVENLSRTAAAALREVAPHAAFADPALITAGVATAGVAAADRRLAQTEVLASRAAARGTAQAAAEQAEIERSSAVIARENLEAKLVERLERRELNAALQQEIRAQRLAGAPAYQGSLFQRFQQYLGARQGGTPQLPADYPTGGQFLGQRFLRTAGFAVSGAALYGSFTVLRSMLDTSEQLELNLAKLNEQLKAIGKGDQFTALRQSILDTARDTGVSTADVALLSQQFLGLYGSVNQAAAATESAAEIIRVTGIAAATAGPQLAAVAEDLGVSVQKIGDYALDVQDKTGRAAKDTLTFFGTLAPVAKDLNINFEQLRGLAEATQKYSGRPSAAIAEGLARILPQFQQKLPQLLQVPGLRLSAGALGGDPLQILKDIISQYDRLGPAAQRAITAVLGGPRQAQFLAAAFSHPAEALKALNDQSDANGRLSRANSASQETLRGSLDRARQSAQALAFALYRGGIGQALTDLVTIGGGFVQFLANIASAIEKVDHVSHGLVGVLAETGAILYGLSRLQELTLFRSMLTQLPKLIEFFQALATAEGREAAMRLLGFGATGAGAGAAVAAEGAAINSASSVANLYTAGGVGLGARLAGGGAIAGSLIAYRVAQSIKDQANRDRNRKLAAAERLSDAEIQRQLATQSDSEDIAKFRDSASAYTGKVSNRGVLEQVQRARQFASTIADPLQAIIDAGLVKPDDLKKIQKELEDPSKKKNFDDLKKRYDQYASTAQGRQAINDAAAAKAAVDAGTQVFGDLADTAAQGITSLSELQASYSAGQINEAQLLASLTAYRDKLLSIAPTARTPAVLKEVAQANKAISEGYAKQARAAFDLAKQLRDQAGTGTPQQDIAGLTSLLNTDRQFTDPVARKKAVDDVLTAQQQVFDHAFKYAASVAEQARLLRDGVPIPPEIRVAEITQILIQGDAKWQSFFNTITTDSVQQLEVANQIATLMVQEHLSSREAVVKILKNRVAADLVLLNNAGFFENPAEYQRLKEDIDKANKAIADALNLPDVSVSGTQKPSGDAALQAQDTNTQNALNQRKAELDAKKAAASKNALAQARVDQQIANAEADAANKLTDPIARAAAQAQAEADRIRADTAFVDAVEAGLQSQQDLAEAIANSIGDVVGAARIGVQKAQEHLNYVVSHGGGTAEIAAARVQLVNAQNQYVQTAISEGERQVDVDLKLHRISIGQAVTRLKELEKVATSQREIDDIEIKIRDLINSTNSSLGFDIPTEIKLPTLYEVRRLQQSSATGLGYSGSTVNLYLQLNGTQITPAHVQNALAGALGTDVTRLGTYRKNY